MLHEQAGVKEQYNLTQHGSEVDIFVLWYSSNTEFIHGRHWPITSQQDRRSKH